jgi:hypothetical protein
MEPGPLHFRVGLEIETCFKNQGEERTDGASHCKFIKESESSTLDNQYPVVF